MKAVVLTQTGLGASKHISSMCSTWISTEHSLPSLMLLIARIVHTWLGVDVHSLSSRPEAFPRACKMFVDCPCDCWIQLPSARSLSETLRQAKATPPRVGLAKRQYLWRSSPSSPRSRHEDEVRRVGETCISSTVK